MVAIAVCLGCLVRPSSSRAAEMPPPGQRFHFRIWTRQDGLPSNDVRDLIAASDGYLWVATKEGVARFDGMRFVRFASGNVPEMRSDDCRVLAEDPQGSVWVGTMDGLLRLGGVVEHFEPGRLSLPGDLAVTARQRNNVTALCFSPAGEILVGTYRGVFFLNDAGFAPVPLIDHSSDPGFGIHRVGIGALFTDPLSGLWGGISWGSIHYVPERRGFRLIETPALGGLPSEPLALAAGREGTLFALIGRLSPQHAWLHRWTGERWEKVSNHRLSNGSRPIWLSADSQGRLWLPDGEGAVLCYDGQGFQEIVLPEALSADYATCMVEDREGTFWLGTEAGGITQLRERRIQQITTSNGLPDNNVRAVCSGTGGDIWLGTDAGVARVRGDTVRVFGEDEGLRPAEVRALAVDVSGRVWVGGRHGVHVLDEASGSGFCRLEFGGDWFNGKTRAICAGRDGTVWLGTATGLYSCADGAADTPRQHDGMGRKDVRVLAETASGDLYVGTEAEGLFLVHPDGTVARRLDNASVYALWEDGEEELWAGTGQGIARLGPESVHWVTTRHGLPDDVVNGLIEDAVSNFWIGTDRGLHRVPREDLEAVIDGRRPRLSLVNYGLEEGLPRLETHGQVSQPSALCAPDGHIWFPTTSGALRIDPNRPPDAPQAPRPVIESVRVNGVEVHGNRPGGDRRRADGMLVLPPGSGAAVEFRYTACMFQGAEELTFFHRLKGAGAGWAKAGTSRSASYYNLAPGPYEFEVRARTKYGAESDAQAGIALHLSPQTHQTVWFRVAVSGALLALMLGAWRWRAAGLRRVRRLEQELLVSRERERLAHDLHDVLGARLHKLARLGEPGGGPDEQDATRGHSRFSNAVHEAIGSLKDVIWATYPQNDTVESLVCRMHQHAENYLSHTGVELRFEVQESPPDRPLPAHQRVGMFHAFQEALANVVRHARATRTCITVRCTATELLLSIRDNGQGFEPHSQAAWEPSDPGATDHHGLGNMRRRVEACGGTLTIEATPGRGATVHLRTPLS